MWFRLMMVSFVLNGMSTFGLRIMAALHLADRYTSIYLIFWYLSGTLLMLLVFLRAGRRPTRTDVLVGAGLGAFSALGQNSIGLALANGLPGNVVFPVTLAGGLFLVVATAITFFKERVGPAGIVGIVLGIISIALLSFT